MLSVENKENEEETLVVESRCLSSGFGSRVLLSVGSLGGT